MKKNQSRTVDTVVRFALLVAMSCAITSCSADFGHDDQNVEGADCPPGTDALRCESAKAIREVAFDLGVNPLRIAGIAQAETFLDHCWREPWGSCTTEGDECENGVLVGQSDGACSNGGVGMFQLDYGTVTATIEKYGNDVLTRRGNTSSLFGEDGWFQSVSVQPLTIGQINEMSDNDWFWYLARRYNGENSQRKYNRYLDAYNYLVTAYGAEFWAYNPRDWCGEVQRGEATCVLALNDAGQTQWQQAYCRDGLAPYGVGAGMMFEETGICDPTASCHYRFDKTGESITRTAQCGCVDEGTVYQLGTRRCIDGEKRVCTASGTWSESLGACEGQCAAHEFYCSGSTDSPLALDVYVCHPCQGGECGDGQSPDPAYLGTCTGQQDVCAVERSELTLASCEVFSGE